jgi:phosphate transport system substrate-binding protein
VPPGRPSKTRRVITCAAFLGAAAIAATGCGSDNRATASAQTTDTSCSSGALAGGGSTFQLNIQQQWSADYRQQCADAQVNYNPIGSGAGIQQFGAGTLEFAGSDVPMLPDEQQAADKRCDGKAVTFPVTAGGVAIIYNLADVPHLKLSATTLARIFQGSVKHWNDAAIKRDNPGVTLPSTAVVTYHRADGSGTTAVFSAFEKATAGKAWTLGSSKELSWPSGQGATGSDGVVQGVKSTKGGITYAEVSYATANSLPTASVAATGNDYVSLTSDSVTQAIATKGHTGYPLSTVSYVIVCSHYSNSTTAAAVKSYLGYALGAGQSAAEQLGYAPLPRAIVTKSRAALDSVS